MYGNQHPKLTEAEIASIQALYKDGKTVYAICKALHRHRNAVERILFDKKSTYVPKPKKAQKRKPPKTLTVQQVDAKAKAEGISYGKWVSRYEQPREEGVSTAIHSA